MIVRSGPTNKDSDVLGLDQRLELFQSPDDALERGCHVGEIGDPAPDDEDLALWVGFPNDRVGLTSAPIGSDTFRFI